jgi:Tol biopolymer transport system component
VSENATQPNISPDGKRVIYITAPAQDRSELWVSDIDGGNKVKLATGEGLATGRWAPDNFHLAFGETGAAGAADKSHSSGPMKSGLRQLPKTADYIWGASWSPDQKSVYGMA